MILTQDWQDQITKLTQNNQNLLAFIRKSIELTKPDSVRLVMGGEQEYQEFCQQLVKSGTLTALNSKKRPNSYLARSNPEDVARVEGRTFICSDTKEQAGPTNNWEDPETMRKKLHQLFDSCMRGRTLYIIPYCMGPLGSSSSHIGIELTDSCYVVVNMMLMTRVGKEVLKRLGTGFFVPGLHSVGSPLSLGQQDVAWPCNPEQRHIVHFPQDKSIWSFGSGYGGNALLGKKCFALRIASNLAKEQGWLAEHMLILGITNPKGVKRYIAAAFPSACGKTNLAMLKPKLKGWKVECVGDDIAWMTLKEDGRLYAVNPEAGFFGVAPGTSQKTNPYVMDTIQKNTLFTNVGLTCEQDVWWEGLEDAPPEGLIDWYGEIYDPNSGKTAAHPNARFTVAASQLPIIDERWEDPEGVPISAILFGGRRSDIVPLVTEAFNWEHGTFMGASVSSQTTAAAQGKVGKLRHDPFAMLPFCGYNIGDYFSHWLSFGEKSQNLPKIFYVNWFRKKDGQWLWPGFGDNARVLKWVFDRCEQNVEAKKTPIGYVPHPQDIDVQDLQIDPANLQELVRVDKAAYLEEMEELFGYFQSLGKQVPKVFFEWIEKISSQLKSE